MAQTPYPPLTVPSVDNLAATDKSTIKELHRAPYLLVFIDSWKQGVLGVILEAFFHPAGTLLQTYVEEVILVHTGPPWSMQAL